MRQLTLQFESNAIKNRFLKIVKLMNGISVVKAKSKKCDLDEALDDVKAGCVYKVKDVDNLF